MSVERLCFLCGSKVETIFSVPWVLPGIATSEIGFAVCPDCGSAIQSPTVSKDDMMRYYSTTAVYTNPGRQEKPSDAKIRDLDEQIQFIKRGIGQLPDSALQIGSSDGYTLSRFREAGVRHVLGVEPGTSSVELAQRLYDVNSIHTTAEELQTDDTFDLILLTHVLEHLYEPQDVLKKCRDIQSVDNDQFIYVEVPLLAPLTSLTPGFFAFEHINYYTRDNLLRSIREAGYYPISIVEHNNSNLSPIIGVLASTQEQHHYVEFSNEYHRNKDIITGYRQREVNYWQACVKAISDRLDTAKRIYLWGAGIHTSQLVANTRLLERWKISGLTDGSELKWGIEQGPWTCVSPEDVDWQSGDAVIISSYASEKEIYDSLRWLRDKGVQTLRLHNVDNTKAH